MKLRNEERMSTSSWRHRNNSGATSANVCKKCASFDTILFHKYWNKMIVVVPFNPGHCMILRFYELKLMVGSVIPNLFGNKIHSWNAENNSLLCRIVLSGPWNTHISFSCTHQGSKYNEFVKIWGDFTRKNEKKTIKYVILNLAGTNCEIVLVLGWRMENLISPSSVIPRYLIIKKCMLFLSTKLGLRLYIHFSNSSKTGK